MRARFRSWWQQIRIHPVATLLISFLAVVIGLIILSILGYIFNWDWTGLGPYVSPPHSTDSDFQRGKTLWDWLQLLGVLAIPVVVGFGAVWFTTRQGKVADAENKDNQRETALQAYIDKMSELLLHENLRDSQPEAEARTIARVRTITILHQLDARRIGYVFSFLRESGLMSATSNKSIVSLSNANLRNINFSGAELYEADLRSATLEKANLFAAFLAHTNFGNAMLSQANLSCTILFEANLSGAYLEEANLSSAILLKANLSDADLTKANLEGVVGITQEQLAQAKSLKGATMPDGSIHP